MPSQIVSSTDHGSLVVSSNLISRPPWKRFLKKSEFPHVKNLKNHSPWVPRDYTKRTPVGTHGPIRRPRIPLFKGGESVIRLSLGRRLVNLLPVAQRTNAFHKWRRRQDSSVLPSTPYCKVTGRRHRVSPCRSVYFASPWLLTLDLRRRSRETALLFPES